MEYSGRMCRKEENTMMKLKKHGAFLVNFVIDFANGDMSRFFFDLGQHRTIKAAALCGNFVP